MSTNPIGNNRNLQVLRGLSTNNSLLNSTADGYFCNLSWIDDGSGRQRWNITLVPGFNDIYNIRVVGGINNPRVFLSCTEDGKKVDLWDHDDGSGRQRWQIVQLSSNIPSYFNIKVVGGVPKDKIYLSCDADGSKVNLWFEDDGSGRQRWQLQ